MAVVPSTCRLKVVASLLAVRTSRVSWTECVEAGRKEFQAGRCPVINPVQVAADRHVAGRERTCLNVGHRGQNSTLQANKYKCHGRTRQRIERRAFLLDGGLSNVLQPPLAPIKQTWKFSKEHCPSRGYHGSSTKRLSDLALKLYSPANKPSSVNFSSDKTNNPIYSTRYRFENRRGYSSCKGSDKDVSKPDKCQTTCDKQGPQQKPTCKMDEASPDECPPTSRPCGSVPEPPPVQCTTTPCPDINDYCQESPDLYKVKFWKMLSYLMMPIIIIMSGFTYSRVMERDKQPRPEFVDYPYMRRIVKPFPWRDGRRTLFHNPVKNPISPHGYEVEDPNALPPKDNTKS